LGRGAGHAKVAVPHQSPKIEPSQGQRRHAQGDGWRLVTLVQVHANRGVFGLEQQTLEAQAVGLGIEAHVGAAGPVEGPVEGRREKAGGELPGAGVHNAARVSPGQRIDADGFASGVQVVHIGRMLPAAKMHIGVAHAQQRQVGALQALGQQLPERWRGLHRRDKGENGAV
jgi:hypothetical protein